MHFIYNLYKYIDDVGTLMAIHSVFGGLLNNDLVESYHGNYPQFYRKIKYFKCGEKCRNVPKCYSLRILDVEDTKVRTIPRLPNLHILKITGSRVKKIPFLPNLRVLYCDRSKISINLHQYPKLIELNGIKIRR